MSVSLKQSTRRTNIDHNNREMSEYEQERNEHIDTSKSNENIYIVKKDLKELYAEEFGESLEKYNAKQKRNDRKIENYFEHIQQSKKTSLQQEMIIQVGDKDDFLRIALFDIWLSNEDRNHNNFNLLLSKSSEKFYFFYAIDHVNIFNTSSLSHGLYEISVNESILKTELAKILFSKNKNTKKIVTNLVENFYLCTDKCKDSIDEIFAKIPASWDLDLVTLWSTLKQTIFTEDWLKTCDNTFREYVQSCIFN